MLDPRDRSQFLNFAGLVEGGLALLALGLGWVFRIDPLEHLSGDWRAVGWGVVGTAPLFGLFLLAYRFPVGPFRSIRGFLSRELAPSLALLTWFDLILMAALAGLAEELLFRGFLEPWLGRFGSNVIFGLAHLVTPTYGIMTFVVGYYLSWLITVADPPNLLVPIVTHGLHDYLAFLVIVWLHRLEARNPKPETGSGNEDSLT